MVAGDVHFGRGSSNEVVSAHLAEFPLKITSSLTKSISPAKIRLVRCAIVGAFTADNIELNFRSHIFASLRTP
jgi:hypothetical protein